MAIKKIIKNAFEQVREVGSEMAKSSVKQVKETLSPWEMIRNSFSETDKTNQTPDAKLKEMQAKNGGTNTPLDFDKLNKSYANQDQQKIQMMKQRLFQMVKRDDEKTLQRSEQGKAEKQRQEAYEESEKKRRMEEQKRQSAMSAAPEGKSGRGSALSRKKRKATEPQPAETKPGSSKQ
ncbi:MAG: hypothetical protein NTV98_01440 [Candidatus Roizmanbacteria bacterium]|nr:hypothetical protein [Candidatus Roizmanbacteria bacterium]